MVESIDDSTQYTWKKHFKQLPNPDQRLVVIGAGMMRTGTKSLQLALEVLLKERCYHMIDVVCEKNEDLILACIEAYERKLENTSSNQSIMPEVFWKSFYANYGAAVDVPTSFFYEELMKVYPEAKIILTVRDPDEWVDSILKVILLDRFIRVPTIGDRVAFYLNGTPSLAHMIKSTLRCAFGEHHRNCTREKLRKVYTEWNEAVQRKVPSDRLLVYDVRRGWEPLCAFLNVEVPTKDHPFPWANSKQDMLKFQQNLFNVGDIVDNVLFYGSWSLVIAAAVATYRWIQDRL